MNETQSEAATEVGWKAFNENRFKDAAALLEKATLLYPDSAIAHFRPAFSYRMLNRHDEALAHFNLAAQMDPDDAGYRYQIGKQKAMRGDFIAALPHFADSLERDSMRIGAYHDAGACTARLGYLELAVLLYTTCGVLMGVAKSIGFRHDVSEGQYLTTVDTLRGMLGDRYYAVNKDALDRLGLEDVDKNNFKVSPQKLDAFAHELANALRCIK